MDKDQELWKVFSVKLRRILTAMTIDFERLQEIRLRVWEPLLVIYDNREFFVGENGKLNTSMNDTYLVKPEDIRTVEDLPKLPFTVKQDLRDNYPYGMFAIPHSEVAEIHASSGTTGKQTVVGYSAKDLDTWGEIAARAIVAAGGSKEDYLHVSYGYGLFTGGLGIHYGGQKMGASVIPVSTGNTKRQIQIMEDFGSTILACTPSYAL